MTVPLVVAFLLLLLDQATKLLVKTYLSYGQSVPIIEGILHITYIQNPGAAFGILKDHRWVFLCITSLLLILGVILLIKRVFKSKSMIWAVCLILSGGIGNMIDRISLGHVVDFIDVRFFYVFNVADSCIVIGAGLLILHYILDLIKEYREQKATGKS